MRINSMSDATAAKAATTNTVSRKMKSRPRLPSLRRFSMVSASRLARNLPDDTDIWSALSRQTNAVSILPFSLER